MIVKVSKYLINDNEVWHLKNKHGKTIQERLTEEISFAKGTKDIASKTMLATKALGAVDIAVEFGLITMNEWNNYIEDIFQML